MDEFEEQSKAYVTVYDVSAAKALEIPVDDIVNIRSLKDTSDGSHSIVAVFKDAGFATGIVEIRVADKALDLDYRVQVIQDSAMKNTL